MQVKGVDFLLTFKCPSKCRHCSYKAGPERIGFMDLTDTERWLTELTDTQLFQSLTVHGGEPFLYFEVLKEILKKAKELKVPQRWVITNGYWAKTKAIAEKKLDELKKSGLSCITFSADAFHQEYIPLETVRTGIEAATRIGFDMIAVDSYLLGSEDADNVYNTLTKKISEGLGELPNVQFSMFPADFEGRATDLLIEYVEPRAEIPTGRCELPYWLGGDLENPEGIEIDFEGNVTLCPGICIGNAINQSLPEVLKSYDYRYHPIIRIIVEEGPIGLLRLATAKGYKEDRKFVDECHLCYEMRKFLRRYYTRYLSPENCY